MMQNYKQIAQDQNFKFLCIFEGVIVEKTEGLVWQGWNFGENGSKSKLDVVQLCETLMIMLSH